MIRYIKTFEVIFSRNNLSGIHIYTMWHSWNVYKYFCPLSVHYTLVSTNTSGPSDIFTIYGIRLNRCLKWYEGFEKDRKVFVLTVLHKREYTVVPLHWKVRL